MDLTNVKKISELFEKAINNPEKGHLIIICIPDEENIEGTYKTMISSELIPREQIYFILHKFLLDLDNINYKNKVLDDKKEIKFKENQHG